MNTISIEKILPGSQMKTRLRRWIGHERAQMDFRLKKLRRGHCGLNMGLGPGPYCGDPMPDDSFHIAEDVFWFLEPGIKKHCTPYTRPYAHYGVTEIPREEWMRILLEWENLRVNLGAAKLTPDLGILRCIGGDARRRFVSDFDRNRLGLSRMIVQLTKWMRSELVVHEQISVLGI